MNELAKHLQINTNTNQNTNNMQYPQIQFYKGSLVRLASGKLKRVEDLNSDDFLERAKYFHSNGHHQLDRAINQMSLSDRFGVSHHRINNSSRSMLTQQVVDENNNSVFNSPEPTPSYYSPPLDEVDEEDDDDDDIELDVVSSPETQDTNNATSSANTNSNHSSNSNHQPQQPNATLNIDSGLVKDFLEVSSSDGTTVLIKFLLESARTVVFIEVPIEHPFFVIHHGWSSWNPQRTYDKFNLKCRKLKIGDICISLTRRK